MDGAIRAFLICRNPRFDRDRERDRRRRRESENGRRKMKKRGREGTWQSSPAKLVGRRRVNGSVVMGVGGGVE